MAPRLGTCRFSMNGTPPTDRRKWRQLHSSEHQRRASAQRGNVRHAEQQGDFAGAGRPKWLRGCTWNQKFASCIHENSAMRTIRHGVGHILNAEKARGAGHAFANLF